MSKTEVSTEHVPLQSCRGQAFLATSWLALSPWHSLAHSCITPISASAIFRPSIVCLCLLGRTRHVGLGAHPAPV